MRRRIMPSLAIVVGLCLLVTACAAGANDAGSIHATHIAGFWLGLWHGLISPITFLISLFDSHVNLYDVHNNGNWYNFGFMLGISMVFSGPASSRCGGRNRAQKRQSAGL